MKRKTREDLPRPDSFKCVVEYEIVCDDGRVNHKNPRPDVVGYGGKLVRCNDCAKGH